MQVAHNKEKAKAYEHPYPWGLEYGFHYRLVAEAILKGVSVESRVIESFNSEKLKQLKAEIVAIKADHAWSCQAMLHGYGYTCTCGLVK